MQKLQKVAGFVAEKGIKMEFLDDVQTHRKAGQECNILTDQKEDPKDVPENQENQ